VVGGGEVDEQSSSGSPVGDAGATPHPMLVFALGSPAQKRSSLVTSAHAVTCVVPPMSVWNPTAKVPLALVPPADSMCLTSFAAMRLCSP
jgi:hypothetical protein